jgi:hypothetical protein
MSLYNPKSRNRYFRNRVFGALVVFFFAQLGVNVVGFWRSRFLWTLPFHSGYSPLLGHQAIDLVFNI